MSSLRLAILASMREAGITSPQQAPSAAPPRKRKSPQPKKDSQPKKKSRPAASPPPPKKSPAKKARPPPSSSSDDDDDSSDDEPAGLRPAAKLPRAPSLPDLKTPKAPKPKPTPKPKPARSRGRRPSPRRRRGRRARPRRPRRRRPRSRQRLGARALAAARRGPSGGPRPGRSAAKEAARRIASHDYQSPEAKAAAAQAAALAAEKERRRPPRPPPKPRTPQEDQKWAQCDRCGTWRRLPPHVDVDRLPERWFCEMNVWDAARARCDAPEPGATTPEAAAAPLESPGAEPQWVQCDGCQKWRRVPHYVDVRLPDRWFCAMNRWDPLRNSCAAPEETAEEQLAPKKRRGPAPGKPARRAPESAGAKRGRNQYTARRDAEERARAEARAAAGPGRRPAASAGSPRGRLHKGRRGARRGPAAAASSAQPRGGAPYLQAARPPKPKPVWNWVQCERAACRKWRRLPLSLKPEALPDAWVCSMNTWDQRFASCEAAQEDEDAIDDGQSEKAQLPRDHFQRRGQVPAALLGALRRVVDLRRGHDDGQRADARRRGLRDSLVLALLVYVDAYRRRCDAASYIVPVVLSPRGNSPVFPQSTRYLRLGALQPCLLRTRSRCTASLLPRRS